MKQNSAGIIHYLAVAIIAVAFSFPVASHAYQDMWVGIVGPDPIVETSSLSTGGNITQVYVWGTGGPYYEGVGWIGGSHIVWYNQYFENDPSSAAAAANEARAFVSWGRQFQFVTDEDESRRLPWAKPDSSFVFDGVTMVGFYNLDRLHLRSNLVKKLRDLKKARRKAKSKQMKRRITVQMRRVQRQIRRL